MNTNKHHLFKDFGVYKATLKKNFKDNDRPAELNHVAELLARRTQWYTTTELRQLFGFLWTAHDECVDSNPEEYHHLQVRASREKIRFGEEAVAKLDRLDSQSPIC